MPFDSRYSRASIPAAISALSQSRRHVWTHTAVLRCLAALFVLFFPANGAAAQTQTPPTGEIKGTISDENQPLPGARLSFANVHAGKTFKIRADDFGKFSLPDAPYGFYDVEVVSADGDRLYKQQLWIVPAESARSATVNIDVSRSKMSSQPGSAETYGRIRTLPEPNTKNNRKRNNEIQKQNEKVSQMNALILQANAAVLDRRWNDALPPLLELTGMEPDNWEYLGELGDVQYNLGQYQEAVGSYESAILSVGEISGSETNSGDPDFARKKSAVSQMLTNEGNSYNNLHRTAAAIAAYNKAAALAADPSSAYFNLCVTQYNLKSVEGTMAACGKAISVTPGNAEPYYFEGALLVAMNQPAATGKVTAPPPGAADALNKYLELAPNGEHAAEVREMLNYLAALARAASGTNKKN